MIGVIYVIHVIYPRFGGAAQKLRGRDQLPGRRGHRAGRALRNAHQRRRNSVLRHQGVAAVLVVVGSVLVVGETRSNSTCSSSSS